LGNAVGVLTDTYFCYKINAMIYMIGGPPRTGKSSLAQLIMKNYQIPYVSTGGLTAMLKPIGQPSFYNSEKSERFFPYLELFIDRMSDPRIIL